MSLRTSPHRNLACVALSVLLSFSGFAWAVPEKPNIIVVLADDLSADVLTCYGGESVQTPVLDGLAAKGMRYTHCFSPAVCMPSRTELLTGKYSHRNYLGRGNVAPGEATIASELKRAGYATCQLEKWHIEYKDGAIPPQAGFDEFYHVRLANNYPDPVVNVNGTEKTYPGGYGPKVCQDFAFDFIARHKGSPFFLYYAMHLPHAPFHVPPGSDLPEDAGDIQKYLAMVEHQDFMVGELVDHLESLELRERTLLIFIGDNGTPQEIVYRSGGREIRGGKASLRDSGTRVPMIVSWPGTAPEGVVTGNLVDFADFLPTAMEAADLQPGKAMDLSGRSFYRQLLGEPNAPKRDYAFKFGVRNAGRGAGPSGGYWARTQRWKLYDDGRFFDIPNDPLEEKILKVESLPAATKRAHGHLEKVLKNSGAKEATAAFRKAEKSKDKGVKKRPGSVLQKTDSYGGNVAIRAEATGFFRVEKINGRWLFITPEGNGYLPLGANHVGKYLDQQAGEMGLLERVGGEREEAANYLIDAMRDLGLNAGEAYAPIAPELKKAFPWVANIRFPGKSKYEFDVFDPEFQKRLTDSFVKQCEGFRDDPMVLGIACADLPVWDERRITYFEQLPEDSPGGKELAAFRRVGKSDAAFLGHVADRLYRHLKAATLKAAPNHLFFGERFRLRGAPDEVISAVGKYVDVFCTQALILSPQRPPEWQLFQTGAYDHEHELTGGKPMLIIDWAAPFSLGDSFSTERGRLEKESHASTEAAEWLIAAMRQPYIVGVFKCQLIGLHGNDAQFDGKSRRTYLKDDGTPWPSRTGITRESHTRALQVGYGAVVEK